MSGNCCKGFQGQRSYVNVITAEAYILTAWRRGSLHFYRFSLLFCDFPRSVGIDEVHADCGDARQLSKSGIPFGDLDSSETASHAECTW